ncbi:MAG: RNA chaperone Hfq [Jaaginema sp. PMC 1079.18]|nr:RNA chaperone Hfq [Jaaginema sp. PMC 1080.18]MEC4852845.1 RNA chaperone Hfq [Jaaginema sp. PMC 1079.18]MEC4865626.1 RNA chaperone Hfq [Jaaginema sp. PMC 1078.18]
MTDIEVESNYPSFRLLQGYIKDHQTVEVKLLNGETLTGQVVWQDIHCLYLQGEESSGSTLIWRQAIAYIQPKA